MTTKPVWSHPVEEAAFREKNCRVCFQPDEAIKRTTGRGDGCPHLLRAAQNKLPTPWTRRRNATMGDTYRCDDYAPKAPTKRRKTAAAETIPFDEADELFEIAPGPVNFVPVEGWPDPEAFGVKQTKGVEHQ